ncbi:MAG: pilus assembly protein PilM [Phycisphaerales bacterium]|nr:MAG: pilus assembly protein PilM [Phycisphaerales bacterium]
MFTPQHSPIAVDFGTSSVKVLQIGMGDRPSLLGAACMDVPEHARKNPEQLFTYYGHQLPVLLQSGRFKGRRAVCAIPSGQTFIQHMQLSPIDGVSTDDLVKAQLQTQMGCAPDSVVVRSVDVGSVHRDGQAKTEMICFAIARDTVMRYIELLRKCRLEVVGAHTEIVSMVRAFDHLSRRESDREITTVYVDLGSGGTRVAISHGRDIVFARYIQVGGRHFDQHIAATFHCDMNSARAHRLSMQSIEEATASRPDHPGSGESTAVHDPATGEAAADNRPAVQAEPEAEGPTVEVQEDRRVGVVPPELSGPLEPRDALASTPNVDLSELLDTITDELSMCLRYHRGLFPDRRIDRAIFLGGEARQMWMCQHIVKELRFPAQMGDPLARLVQPKQIRTPGLTLGTPQPGWAVACGLCMTPTNS